MRESNRKINQRFVANAYPLSPGMRLLEASAGTGKTFAIAHLVLRLLTEKEYALKEILVVTFTKSSAAELKARISKRLELTLQCLESIVNNNEINPPDEVLEEWLKKEGNDKKRNKRLIGLILIALEEIDRSDITTIHGFCMRNLKRETLDSSIPIDPKLEKDPKKLILEVVHEYWNHHMLSLNPGHLSGLKDAGITIDSLCRELEKVDSEPNLELVLDELIKSATLKDYFEDRLNHYWKEFITYWEIEGKELEEDLCNLAKEWRLNGVTNTKPFSPKPNKNRYKEINLWLQKFDNNKAMVTSNIIPLYEEIRQQKLLIDYFHPKKLFEASSRSNKIHFHLPKPKLQQTITELWDGPAEEVWKHALYWTSNILSKRRKQLNLISYSEIIKALDPKNNKLINQDNKRSQSLSLFQKLGQRYKVALIDEFQDTDPLQWRLLETIFGNSSNHLLLMVGDPKQAIYRFRGGDLNTYIMAKAKVDRIDELLENFRASPSLMKGINQLFKTGLIHSNLYIPILTPRIEQEESLLQDIKDPLEVLIPKELDSHNENKEKTLCSKSKLEKIIPTAVANRVLELLEDDINEISADDICILVGRHDQANEIRQGLTVVGIPSRLINQGDVLSSESANVLQRFLNCLADPSNSGKLRLLACSPLMQWSAEKLQSAEINGDLDKLAIRFEYWSRNFESLGILGCLANLLEGEKIADLSIRGRMLGDLQQSAQIIEEARHLQGLNAIGAAHWLKQQRLQPTNSIPEGRKPHSDIAESAVNVVTIHRSKGLEYRIVICPYLWQSPPDHQGPLWRSCENQKWIISLNSAWSNDQKIFKNSKKESLQEAERLAYVALTRASDKLIIFWARGLKQEGNPLTSLLFGPAGIKSNIQELKKEKMTRWFNKNEIPISIRLVSSNAINRRWNPKKSKEVLSLGPTPSLKLDQSWGRSSYSSWISTNHTNSLSENILTYDISESKDRDQYSEDESSSLKEEFKDSYFNIKNTKEYLFPESGPLETFPRGTLAGECLHKILEKLDFKKSTTSEESTRLITEELLRAGLELSHLKSIQSGFDRLLKLSMGGLLGDLKLNELDEKRRIPELTFDMPIALEGSTITAKSIAEIFKNFSSSRLGGSYSKAIEELNFVSRGFLTGSIDLVFTDKEDTSKARWWVADWKSNWIGKSNSNAKDMSCGPINYSQEEMGRQMFKHHYLLQAHIYLVALHRFLLWRLPDYSPSKHLGGYIYFFLRGIPDMTTIDSSLHHDNLPGLFIESAPVELVLQLDELFKKGGNYII